MNGDLVIKGFTGDRVASALNAIDLYWCPDDDLPDQFSEAAAQVRV